MFRFRSQIFVLWSILISNQIVLSSILIDQDQQTLLDLANALETLPNGWNRFNASDACSTWAGVVCYSGAPIVAVSSIRVSNLGIVGTIPGSIGNFKAITSLIITKNSLYGTIPTQIGNLTLIQTIDFSDNFLNGTIPSSIGNLNKTLTQFLLARNKISGAIPTTIGNLKKLTLLQLSDNILSGSIPTEITQLSSLQNLDLSRNYLNGKIPLALDNFVNMTDFSLAYNQLTGPIPTTITQMTRLRTILLQSNALSGSIPDGIGTLTELTKIQIGVNGLVGTIPPIGNLTQLTLLYIPSCKLTGTIPSGISRLSKLNNIVLNSNSLNGTIPPLSQLSILKELNLNGNDLTGTLPSIPGALVTLRVSGNQLTGSISSNLGDLKQLKELALDNNNFNGTIPETIGGLSALTLLYLKNNPLTGCFDVVLPQLLNCDVSGTQLECFPPKCIFETPTSSGPITIDIPAIVGPPIDNIINPPAEESIIPLVVGISVPVGAAIIVGIILLAVFMKKRRRKLHNKAALTQRTTKIELSAILPEKMIIKYEDLKLGAELGAGDFGKVYEGRWHNTQVAVKINVGGDWSNFYNEADLMLNLRPHPNVVQTLGYCEHNNMLVVVLEYCNDGSLDRRLFDDNASLDLQTKIKWMHDIACGVYHLHSNNIIHRDLAARNILLSNNTPKISDFGMSRRVEHITEHSQTKSNIGPIRWMAPEALRDRIYNEKSDVWSFAVVCWEILNQTEPHLAEDPLTIAVKIRDEHVTPEISNDYDQRIASILRQCWQVNPQDRPDMKSICDQFAALLQ